MAASQPKEDGKVAVAVQDVPLTNYNSNEVQVAKIGDAHLGSARFTTFFRSVLSQMILFGA
jgi:hypothetical protein